MHRFSQTTVPGRVLTNKAGQRTWYHKSGINFCTNKLRLDYLTILYSFPRKSCNDQAAACTICVRSQTKGNQGNNQLPLLTNCRLRFFHERFFRFSPYRVKAKGFARRETREMCPVCCQGIGPISQNRQSCNFSAPKVARQSEIGNSVLTAVQSSWFARVARNKGQEFKDLLKDQRFVMEMER